MNKRTQGDVNTKLNLLKERLTSLKSKHHQTMENYSILVELQAQTKEEISMTQEDLDAH